jgi:hypothetical protein
MCVFWIGVLAVLRSHKERLDMKHDERYGAGRSTGKDDVIVTASALCDRTFVRNTFI